MLTAGRTVAILVSPATESSQERGLPALETQAQKSLDARIERALDLMHHGSNRQLAVCELAENVGLSDSHFHHLFRRETGVSPAKYLRNLKLRDAAHLIKTTPLSIKEVFSMVGVCDPSHFIRRFREAYGVSPSSYRNGHRDSYGNNRPRDIALRSSRNLVSAPANGGVHHGNGSLMKSAKGSAA